MSADLASLRIAEDRIQWGVLGCDGRVWPQDSPADAVGVKKGFDGQLPECGPHRVVSRRVITTCWEAVG